MPYANYSEIFDTLSSTVKQDLYVTADSPENRPSAKRIELYLELLRKINAAARNAAIDLAVQHLRETEASVTPVARQIEALLAQKV